MSVNPRNSAISPIIDRIQAPPHSVLMKKATWIASFLFALTLIAKNMAPIQEIPLKDIDGKDTNLGAFAGKTILLVNVASKCGYTPQYEALEAIHKKYADRGFSVVGVPCNDFGGQEPGTNHEIKEFCSSKYSVTFPLLDKVHVKGPQQHPLYAYLTGKDATFPGDVKWNFGKFLIGPDGKVLQRWDSATKPDSAEVTAAIEAALPKK